jgi:LacI family transcriptional regulator
MVERNFKLATIKDIANVVGVSSSTISRVLNYDDTISVSYNTKKKIFKVAEELKYKTLNERKNKRKPITKKVGIINWYSKNKELSDPYYISISTGIEKRCYELEIDIVKIFKDIRNKNKDETKFDGIIALGKFHKNEIKNIERLTHNIVFVDSAPLTKKYDSITVDFKTAVYEIMEYLFKLGHEKIGYIGGKEYVGEEKILISDIRHGIYSEIMKEKNLYNIDFIELGVFSEEDGYRLMKNQLLKTKIPTAYFIASDSMAIGAMRAIYESNLKIPDDISIVGFNDIQTSSYVIPSLTTMKVFTEYMGMLSVELLISKRRDFFVPKKIVLPTDFVIRKSCKKL